MTLMDKIRAKVSYYNFVDNDILALRGRLLWKNIKADADCMRNNLRGWRNRI